ncbi:sensor histidine kinase [Brevibacterium sandarakinum]
MKPPEPANATSPSSDSVAPGVSPSPGSWFRERMWLVDLLVAFGVFLYNLPTMPASALHLIDDPVSYATLTVLSLVMCAIYILRRRFPLAVLVAMLALACAQLLFGAPIIMADIILLFGVYTVATRYAWTVSLPAALVVVGWLLAVVIPRLSDDFIDVGQLGVLIVVTLWVWTWGTLVRIRRQYMDGLRERAEQAERQRETNARIAVADERARIAREIHDIVSHSLSVVVLMSDGAAAKVDSEPERAKSAMLTARDTGRTALTDMRRMLGVLRDDEPGSHAPQPGTAQLDALIEQSRAAGLPVALTVEGEPVSVPDSVGLTIYRLVQEALTNVRNHAGPDLSRVAVLLRFQSAEVEVRIVDDGQGASTRESEQASGHGLVGMRERVAAHRGRLCVGPSKAGGFEVVAVLPVEGGP